MKTVIMVVLMVLVFSLTVNALEVNTAMTVIINENGKTMIMDTDRNVYEFNNITTPKSLKVGDKVDVRIYLQLKEEDAFSIIDMVIIK